jgi:choice-of-anchor C domain-containing protein
MGKLRIGAIATVFALVVAPSVARADVTNGSFEQGPATPAGFGFRQIVAGSNEIPGWQIGGGGINYLYSPTWQASDGVRSLDLNDVSAGVVQQSIATTVAQLYRVTFDMASNPEGTPTIKTLEVSAAGQTGAFSFNSAGKTALNMGWEPHEFLFTANTATTLLAFTSTTSGGFGPGLDHVAVTAVPEPSGTLVCLGAIVFAVRCRQQRS